MSDSNAVERTFVMLKPDALERGLIGEIISRLERKGLKPVRFLWRAVSPELAAKHYERLTSKPFYPLLEAYITRGPVLASVWEGRDAVAVVRRLVGATDPALAEAGTIRGDFGLDVTENLIHASDSPEAAEREIGLFFDGPHAPPNARKKKKPSPDAAPARAFFTQLRIAPRGAPNSVNNYRA